MEQFLYLLRGYVTVRIYGGSPERFLNLCKGRGMEARRVEWREDGIYMQISIREYFLLRPIRKKTNVHIRLVKKTGLPFFLYKHKKRKAFFIGVGAAFAMILFFSTRIWAIHLEGNIMNTTPQILRFLEEQGISHGINKRKINCGKIASMIRQEYPQIAWVSAKIDGTRLLIEVSEGTNLEYNTVTTEAPCSLQADADGTICKMITRAGIPQAIPGMEVTKGDLLISGLIPIMNDSQEVVRYDLVHADADIYIQHEISYYEEFPLQHETCVATGKEKVHIGVRIGPVYLSSMPKKLQDIQQTTELYPLRLTESFTLPAALAVSREYSLLRQPETYTKKEAEEKARHKIWVFEKNLMEKGVQILQNNVTIMINDASCVSSGTLLVMEKTGEEISVAEQEQTTERTAEDG